MATTVLLFGVSGPLERWLKSELGRRGCNVRATHTPSEATLEDSLILMERGRGSIPPPGARVLQVDWSASPDALVEIAGRAGENQWGTPSQRGLVLVEGEAWRVLLRLELETDGYHICEADDGRVALARLADFTPDLVLLDLAMPRFDGCVVLAALGEGALPRPAVILHSAYLGGLSPPFPVAAVLTKPVRLATLRATVRKVLATRAAA